MDGSFPRAEPGMVCLSRGKGWTASWKSTEEKKSKQEALQWLVKKLSPFFKDESGDELPVSKGINTRVAEMEMFWEDWLLWRMVGKNVNNFLLAKQHMSRAKLSTFLEMDSIMSKMENQHLKKMAKKGKK